MEMENKEDSSTIGTTSKKKNVKKLEITIGLIIALMICKSAIGFYVELGAIFPLIDLLPIGRHLRFVLISA